MLVSYKDLCKLHVARNPCPLCGKRLVLKNTKLIKTKVDGKSVLVRICAHHHVDAARED